MTNTLLTLHNPETARRYYAEGLWRADRLYTLLCEHAARWADGSRRSRTESGESVRPPLGIMQNGDYLNHIVSNAIGHDVGRAGDHKLAGALDAPLAADHGKFLQALHSYPNSLDYARCSVRIVGCNPFVDVLQAARVTTWIYEPVRPHRECDSRL
jgi:hypothetical protein